MAFKYTQLTFEQKLHALSLKFYSRLEWYPQVGHYYTSSRNDLELYKVVGMDASFYYTNYCDSSKTTKEPGYWIKECFLTQGFGEKRVWVPNFILDITCTDLYKDLDL